MGKLHIIWRSREDISLRQLTFLKLIVSETTNMTSNTYREEKDLIKGCAQGDTEQRDAFVTQYDRLIRSIVGKVYECYGGSRQEVEDVVNFVYEKLLEDDCRRLTIWHGKSKLSTYLVQVSKNLAVDCLRKQGKDDRIKKTKELPVWFKEIDVPDVDESREPLYKALSDSIDELPPKRSIIMKLRLQGKSLREIAKITKLPKGTVFVENSRAMQSLRDELFALREEV